MKVFILGGNGLLGRRIKEFFINKNNFKIYSITKENYKKFKNKKCNIFINANGNSSRHIGNSNPIRDFKKSIKTTYQSVFDYEFDNYIFLSSIDVYEEKNSPSLKRENSNINISKISNYGLNKLISENIVKHYAKKYIILRLGPVLDSRIKKNHVYDIINSNKVFVNKYTRTSFVSGKIIPKILYSLIKKRKFNSTYNVCGNNLISYNKIDKILKFNSNFDVSKIRQAIGANTKKLQNDLNINIDTLDVIQDFYKDLYS